MQERRSRRQGVVFAVAVILTLAILLETKWHSGPSHHSAGPTSPRSTPVSHSSAPSTPTHSSTSAAPTLSPAQVRAAAVQKVASLTKGLSAGSFSLAAVNMSTGATYSAGATSGMWTASVYKLFILEILLHRAGGPLTGSQASEAIPMIEHSDNVAGYEEFENAGGRSGLQDGFADLGLKHTVAGHADPAFTITSAMDCITLLKNLVTSGPLTSSARAYALNLMEQVESDQRWGVGVAADPGADFANKNGWLSIDNSNGPGENDNGLWAVNSVGVIRIKGQQVLMAVMTRHNPNFDSGVKLVESLAKAIKPLVAS